jgi:aspartate racemase
VSVDPPLRTLGLLGGMTWHSTALYYRCIQERIAHRVGPFRSAPLRMHSVDYGRLRHARQSGQWRRFRRELVRAAVGLQHAGAEGLVICSNTIHALVEAISAESSMHVVHIADALADRVLAMGAQEVALFGTAFTVRQPFYRARLEARGLSVRVADDATVTELDHIILERLARGEVLDADRERFVAAMARTGGDVMALACTEIGMLVGDGDVAVPVLDTAVVHAEAAADWSVRGA